MVKPNDAIAILVILYVALGIFLAIFAARCLDRCRGGPPIDSYYTSSPSSPTTSGSGKSGIRVAPEDEENGIRVPGNDGFRVPPGSGGIRVPPGSDGIRVPPGSGGIRVPPRSSGIRVPRQT
ncbi:hypothetical protein G7054_g8325 [Neopestalotiopsis clavispora]|nr:hypothetical protein G7054_g8325 [Neopestalotiopsis clavispora]